MFFRKIIIIFDFFFLAGEIVNLINVDTQKIIDACLMVNLIWSCPLQVGLAIYFLYQTIGVSVFVGKLVHSNLEMNPDIVNFAIYSERFIVNKTQLPFLGFTKHLI